LKIAFRSFLSLIGLLCGVGVLSAQAPDDVRPIPSKDPTFRIPFQTQPGERRLREVQLYYSTDQGRTWRHYATTAPDQGFFQQFTAQADGLYWFSVRTIDLQGRAYPPNDNELRPGLKVLVDTKAPRVTLRALQGNGNSVGVEWEVRDENLDITSLRLEYLPAGAAQYMPIRVDPVAAGQHYWTPMTNGPMEVRLSVSDIAGNVGQDKVIVTAGGGGMPMPPPAVNQPPKPASNTSDGIRYVNSRRVSLNYRIDDQGPSGVSVIELWYTQDGRNWQKYREEKSTTPPFVFDVDREGLYGFTMVARSGVGLSDRPPQMGDQPQVWVEVDETKPVVQLLSADVGRGADTGNLTICWTASDKNMARQPITLSYSEQAEGPWTTIISNLENTGRYVWRMPPSGTPFRFHIRVEAVDKAGNVGSAQTTTHVIVDLHTPKSKILDVGAAGR
jgi:hypothetical protein